MVCVCYWAKTGAQWSCSWCQYWCRPGFYGMKKLDCRWLADAVSELANGLTMLCLQRAHAPIVSGDAPPVALLSNFLRALLAPSLALLELVSTVFFCVWRWWPNKPQCWKASVGFYLAGRFNSLNLTDPVAGFCSTATVCSGSPSVGIVSPAWRGIDRMKFRHLHRGRKKKNWALAFRREIWEDYADQTMGMRPNVRQLY